MVYATIRTYLAAIRRGHIVCGLPDPLANGLQLGLLLRGVRKHSSGSGRVRLPVTPLVLLRAKEVLAKEPQDYTHIMLWAGCCVGYFAFLVSYGPENLR